MGGIVVVMVPSSINEGGDAMALNSSRLLWSLLSKKGLTNSMQGTDMIAMIRKNTWKPNWKKISKILRMQKNQKR